MQCNALPYDSAYGDDRRRIVLSRKATDVVWSVRSSFLRPHWEVRQLLLVRMLVGFWGERRVEMDPRRGRTNGQEARLLRVPTADETGPR